MRGGKGERRGEGREGEREWEGGEGRGEAKSLLAHC